MIPRWLTRWWLAGAVVVAVVSALASVAGFGVESPALAAAVGVVAYAVPERIQARRVTGSWHGRPSDLEGGSA